MLRRKKQGRGRWAQPRQLLLSALLFTVSIYMCYRLRRGSLAQTLAATKQASAVVKQVVGKQNVSETATVKQVVGKKNVSEAAQASAALEPAENVSAERTGRAAALVSSPTTFANATGETRTGVELHESLCGGGSTRETCGDVIYVVDDRLPSSDNTTYIAAQWRALSHIVENFEPFNGTCIAFYDVRAGVFEARKLHQVWARIEATFAVFDDFPRASYALYMDTDSILSSPRHAPTDMFRSLAVAYRNESSASDVPPSLIVNKPYFAWLCNLCNGYGLGSNCINSGVLLWRRSSGARFVLQKWWESQFDGRTQNFYLDEHWGYFNGWAWDDNRGLDKMSEQNRLMYIAWTIPKVREAMLIGPTFPSRSKLTSCPERVDGPCLQKDSFRGIEWTDNDEEHCYVQHMSERKNNMINISKNILNGQFRAHPSPEAPRQSRSGRLGGNSPM
mmetsp:Transcript_12931/g.29512  ORF Transcript_12931/g.29512 Transcript_12931/m.29512 type:complete len:448 (+) Transcript_12931:89-1432(+)